MKTDRVAFPTTQGKWEQAFSLWLFRLCIFPSTIHLINMMDIKFALRGAWQLGHIYMNYCMLDSSEKLMDRCKKGSHPAVWQPLQRHWPWRKLRWDHQVVEHGTCRARRRSHTAWTENSLIRGLIMRDWIVIIRAMQNPSAMRRPLHMAN